MPSPKKRGRPPGICPREDCKLTRACGCMHCWCDGDCDAEHEPLLCDGRVTLTSKSNKCSHCTRTCRVKTVKREAATEAVAEYNVHTDKSLRVRGVQFSDEQAQWYNKQYVAFLPPIGQCLETKLRTSGGECDAALLALLEPFASFAAEKREPSPPYYVMHRVQQTKEGRPFHRVRLIKNAHRARLTGYDGYSKVHGLDGVSKARRDAQQQQATLGFDSADSVNHYDGWGSWCTREGANPEPGTREGANPDPRLFSIAPRLRVTRAAGRRCFPHTSCPRSTPNATRAPSGLRGWRLECWMC